MKKETRTEGNVFTSRRRERVRYETENEEDMAALAGRMDCMADWSKDPWAAQRPLIEWAAKQLAIERGMASPNYRFKTREDTGWYFSELVSFARIAESNIKKGNASWAAFAGAKFGELWSELQLKLAREAHFIRGLDNERATRDGGEANRKGEIANRLARFDELRRQHVPIMEAYHRIAEEEGSSFTTVGDAIRRTMKKI